MTQKRSTVPSNPSFCFLHRRFYGFTLESKEDDRQRRFPEKIGERGRSSLFIDRGIKVLRHA